MTKKMGVDMPSTLERSPDKAPRTYAKTLRHAEQEYGRGECAIARRQKWARRADIR